MSQWGILQHWVIFYFLSLHLKTFKMIVWWNLVIYHLEKKCFRLQECPFKNLNFTGLEWYLEFNRNSWSSQWHKTLNEGISQSSWTKKKINVKENVWVSPEGILWFISRLQRVYVFVDSSSHKSQMNYFTFYLAAWNLSDFLCQHG